MRARKLVEMEEALTAYKIKIRTRQSKGKLDKK